MNDSANTENDDLESLVGQVADEYTDRVNRGERVEIEEYALRYPQIADVLRQMLPSLGLMGKLSSFTKESERGRACTVALPEYLGEYHILREIGRGGMGVVYEAEQKSLGRRVALKVLPFHRLMDPLYLKRFQREAQAAARLHHTNIVPVFGVGEYEGIHFYAMQFITGHGLDRVVKELKNSAAGTANQEVIAALSDQSFSQYCRRVARIGVQVAEALAYAHSQGILHRDIKPSNLLLDSAGIVWVTDFGLAKADSTEDLTHTGDLVGTLRYVAPERLAGLSDARSDLFSLGLTLYELLTLRPAYDEKTQGLLVQQVTAAEPPLPRRLDRRIPSDLNTIIQKAIAKEPERRYATASEMSKDLQRFLDDRPIEARRTSRLELAWRWGRRNPALAGLTAALFAALLIGLGAVLWQWRLTERQRQQAEANFQKARDAVDECFTVVTQNPVLQEPGMEAARHVLFQTALKYYQDFLNQRADDAGTQADLARAYYRLGYITERIGSKSEARAAYEQASVLFEKLAGSEPDNTPFRVELAQCYQSQGELQRLTGQSDRAETEFLKALRVREELAGDHHNQPDYQNDLAGTLQSLGTLYRTTRRPDQAEDCYRRAQTIRERLIRDFATSGEYRKALAQLYSEFSRSYSTNGKPVEAKDLLTKAIGTLEELVRDHPESVDYQDSLATAHNALGSFLLNSGGGTFEQMEDVYVKALAIREQLMRDHPKVQEYRSELARVYNNLALLHYIAQRDDKAAENYGKALSLRLQLAQKHPDVVSYQRAVATTHSDLGLLYRRARRWSDADRSFREALAIQERLLERNREISDFAIELATTLNNLGVRARDQGRHQESIDWYTRAVETLNAVLNAEPQQSEARTLLGKAYAGRARALTSLLRYGEALAEWDRSLEYAKTEALPGTRLARAATLAQLGSYREAVAEAERLAPANALEKLYFREFTRAHVYAAAASAAAADAKLESADKVRLAEEFAARSLELLERGYEAREFDRHELASLQIDRDFAILRSRPGFRKLLERIEATINKK
ncbi:MAG: protein kinase [Planctomycetes bacterium]|nr:protein kinase [Planctomycetota bacterium]